MSKETKLKCDELLTSNILSEFDIIKQRCNLYWGVTGFFLLAQSMIYNLHLSGVQMLFLIISGSILTILLCYDIILQVRYSIDSIKFIADKINNQVLRESTLQRIKHSENFNIYTSKAFRFTLLVTVLFDFIAIQHFVVF